MGFLRCRGPLVWTAIPLLVGGQVGCAARGLPATAVPPPPVVSAAEQKACEDYSRKQPTKSVVGPTTLGVLLIPVSVGLAGAAVGVAVGTLQLQALQGIGFLQMPGAFFGVASKNAEQNRATRGAAIQSCLDPIILEYTLGPEHPDVARSLNRLADGYVAVGDIIRAEPLYQRAVTIREKTLGPQHPDVATTLESYAALLRKMNREVEAEEMEARARAITSVRSKPTP